MDLLTPISKLKDDYDKLSRVREMRSNAHYAAIDWLQEAQRCAAFKAGDQWTASEKEALNALGREPMVWNYVHSMVELIVGIRAQNEINITLQPVESSDGFLCEVVQNLIDWIEENQTDARILDAEAFEDATVTGKGFRSVDVQPRPDNPTEVQFIEENVPFWQVKIDPGSRKQDLSDARYVIVEKWVSLEDFKVRYPEHAGKVADIFYAHAQGSLHQHTNYEFLEPSHTLDDDYTDSLIDHYDFENLRVLVCQVEYFENYTRHYWIDETNPGRSQEIDLEAAQAMPPNQVLKVPGKKVRWLHYTGDYILYDDDSPIHSDHFSVIPMYAYPDKSKRTLQHYGIVKLLIDPQRECNRRWLQSIRLMANQGVGLVGEVAAFLDLDQAQESWTNPDEITLLKEGGLGKIKEKTAIDFPAASVQMQEVSRESMKQISGINSDLMGFRDKQEPGIVLQLRQQQGMTILARMFENYRRMRELLARLKAHLVIRYIPDWQIQKILGENDRYLIQEGHIIDKEYNLVAPLRAIRDLKYNVKYEYSEVNMTKTMSELAIFMDMISKGFPVNPETVIDKLDLPETEKTKWKEYVKKGQEQQQQMAQAQQQMAQQSMMMDMQDKQHKLALENEKIKGTLALKDKEIEYRKIMKDSELAMKQQTTAAELTMEKTIADEDRRVDIAELEIKREGQREKTRIDKAKAVTEIGSKNMVTSNQGAE
jgi:hypothetical protein